MRSKLRRIRGKKGSNLPLELKDGVLGLALMAVGLALLFGFGEFIGDSRHEKIDTARLELQASRDMLTLLNSPFPGTDYTYANMMIQNSHDQVAFYKDFEHARDYINNQLLGVAIIGKDLEVSQNTVKVTAGYHAGIIVTHDIDGHQTYYLPDIDGGIIKIIVQTKKN